MYRTGIPSYMQYSFLLNAKRFFMLISLIAPAYNEEGNIAPFAESAAAALFRFARRMGVRADFR